MCVYKERVILLYGVDDDMFGVELYKHLEILTFISWKISF